MALEQAARPGVVPGAALRADFPLFDRPHRSERPLVFLDSAASSPKPRAVIDALADMYAHHYANVHRGIYELSEDATARFEAARRAIARFIGAPSEREVVFVRNATEAINLVAYSWGRANVRAGDRILSTEMEHHANLVPWQQLAAATGATIEYVRITDDGRLDVDDLRARLPGSRLLAFSAGEQRAGDDQPGRRDRGAGTCGRPPSRCSTPRRASPTCRSTWLRWAWTSRRCPGTRCSARRASVSCGGVASFWTPCRPS